MTATPKTDAPIATAELPLRRRLAYERAICSFIRPDDPDAVSLADVDRFCRSKAWHQLYAGLEAAFAPPPGEDLTMHIMRLFDIQKEQGTLR